MEKKIFSTVTLAGIAPIVCLALLLVVGCTDDDSPVGSGGAKVGWYSQQIITEGNLLIATTFLDENSGWLVGQKGVVVHTDDGGTSWLAQNSGTARNLWDVTFVGADSGWAVGENRTIVRTTDGGATWSQALSESLLKHLYSTAFVDNTTGWVVGAKGTIIVTSNGGIIWDNSLSNLTELDLKGIFAFSEFDTTYWVCNSGAHPYCTDSTQILDTTISDFDFIYREFIGTVTLVGETGTILRTTDGGATWSEPNSTTGETLWSVFFIDENKGWAVGENGVIVHSADSGASWAIQGSGVTDENLYEVEFANATEGWIVGENGTILTTSNGGSTWTIQENPTHRDLFGLALVNDGGWIVGSNTVLSSADRDSWTDSPTGTVQMNTLEKVVFGDENNGWAVGFGGTILHTKDGGDSWDFLSHRTDSWFLDAFFVDNTKGWCVGIVGLFSDDEQYDGLIVRTTDGGMTWDASPPVDSVVFYSVVFVDELNGWVAGGYWPYTFKGVIYNTSDGGVNWTLQDSTDSKLNGIDFVDADNGWAVGYNGTIVRTTDGGAEWTTAELDTLQTIDTSIVLWGVDFVHVDTGWVVSSRGAVYRTTDAGITWITQTSDTTRSFRDVKFLNSDTGWVAGANGILLYTSDGGESWTQQGTETVRDLMSVWPVNASLGWAVGEDGAMLKTTSGGR